MRVAELWHIAQRGSGNPVPENIQHRVRQDSEQPDLLKDVLAHCRGVKLDGL